MKSNFDVQLHKDGRLWELETEFFAMIDSPERVQSYINEVEQSGETIDRYHLEFECYGDPSYAWKCHLNSIDS